jgi:hypothetical protein
VSIEAIRAATAGVRDQAVAAHREVAVARERLAEAMRTLADLTRHHPTSLVPPEHRRADEQLGVCLERLAGGIDCLDRFVGRL